MSIKQMLLVWEHEFPHPEQSVMLALADHAHEDGTGIRPSIDRVAWKTGYSRRNVQMILGRLKTSGVVETETESTPRLPAVLRFNWQKATVKPPFDDYKTAVAERKKEKSRGADSSPLNNEAIGDDSLPSLHPWGEAQITPGVKPRSPEPSITHQQPSDPPNPQGGITLEQAGIESTPLPSERDQPSTIADRPGSENQSSAAPPPKSSRRKKPDYQRWIATYLAHKPKAWSGMEKIEGITARENCVIRGLKAYGGDEDEALRRLELALKYVKKVNDDFWVDKDHSFETILRKETMHMVRWAESAIGAGLTTGSTEPGSTPDDLEARKARRREEVLAQARAESDRLMQGAA